MNFKVHFRQGSFLREFHCATLDEAITVVGRMSGAEGCSDFQIVGEGGQLLLDHYEIIERFRLSKSG